MCPNRASGPQNHPMAKVALSVSEGRGDSPILSSILAIAAPTRAPMFLSFDVVGWYVSLSGGAHPIAVNASTDTTKASKKPLNPIAFLIAITEQL